MQALSVVDLGLYGEQPGLVGSEDRRIGWHIGATDDAYPREEPRTSNQKRFRPPPVAHGISGRENKSFAPDEGAALTLSMRHTAPVP